MKEWWDGQPLALIPVKYLICQASPLSAKRHKKMRQQVLCLIFRYVREETVSLIQAVFWTLSIFNFQMPKCSTSGGTTEMLFECLFCTLLLYLYLWRCLDLLHVICNREAVSRRDNYWSGSAQVNKNVHPWFPKYLCQAEAMHLKASSLLLGCLSAF